MPDLKQYIVDRLHQQQDWLQNAAERLLQHGTLDEENIGQLTERLKSADGQRVTKNRVFIGLAGASAPVSDLRLVSIANVKGIENLSPRKPLAFGSGNLTVVYGRNGSGKSSYTRILKKACGKPHAVDLKPNVFQDPPADRQCDITYSVGSAIKPVSWMANSDVLAELEPVDIFDGDAAKFYLRGESEASYIPPAVALFEELARTCVRIKDKLQTEQNKLVSKLPALPPEYADTPAGKGYQALKPGQTDESLKSLLEWNKEDQDALDQLAERLKSEDPATLAKQKRARKRELDAIVNALRKAETALGNKGFKRLQTLKQTAKDHRRQATEAARVDTASAQLEGIGTDTWIALWEAARDFSVNLVYPGQAYPFTIDDARCVLCNQTLDDDAKQRLKDFERYVQSQMESNAKAAEEDYHKAIDGLPKAPSVDEIRTLCQAAGLSEEPWHAHFKDFWSEFQKVRDKVKLAEISDGYSGFELPTQLIDEVTGMAEALEDEAVQHDTDAQAFDREKALQDKLELGAKRWASQQSTSIRDEVARLGKVSHYEAWKSFTHTKKVSDIAGVVSEKAITTAYVKRFNDELKALGAERIKVELIQTRIELGKAKHQIQLKNVKADRATPDSVLSDGERRVVALAAFLADVTGKPHAAPFIFDDPISSLDHDFEWGVAMRLARLAQDRQVVVLTHRLSLYGAMGDAAKKVGEGWKKKNLMQRCIESFAGTAGHPVDEAVWNANTKQANNILINHLNDAKKYWKAGDSANYKIHAQTICTDFRKLLERMVEEDLLNQIVKRHRRSITTDNRISKLSKITKEDCTFIDGLMTKYSCYEHSQSHETPTFLPDEPELRKDLEELRDWREEFSKRPEKATV